MLRQQRLDLLRELVLTTGGVSVSETARIFDVSLMTARRDLAAVSALGDVSRVHGGAVAASWAIAVAGTSIHGAARSRATAARDLADRLRGAGQSGGAQVCDRLAQAYRRVEQPPAPSV